MEGGGEGARRGLSSFVMWSYSLKVKERGGWEGREGKGTNLVFLKRTQWRRRWSDREGPLVFNVIVNFSASFIDTISA